MKLLLHDLNRSPAEAGPDRTVLGPGGVGCRPCLGCFGCWVKTPGACVIRDGVGDMGALLARCDRVDIVSRCRYGGFSPFVKNVLDRSIPYLHPDFVYKNGEMHHRRRYQNAVSLWVWFYGGGLAPAVRETAKALVEANAVNLAWTVGAVRFFTGPEEWEELV